ncbi:MAG TPA: methyltransferase domain-containing protein [Kofleriaceae bacterium]|nr:methyltransferase domain-containing protein [Kofleriaceae bacterium]
MDRHRADAFAGQMRGLLNHAMLGLMVSIGHRTGLFDAMAALPPSPCGAVADAAGLDERHVREWLGAMVTGGIVEYDGRRATYFLPREHAASLTRGAGPHNLARLSGMVSTYGAAEDRVIDCFRRGGGVPATDLASGEEVCALVPGLVERLRDGLDVVEVGESDGSLARAFPASRVGRAAPAGLSALAPATVDVVVAVDVLHDLPVRALEGVCRALRPGGVLVCRDIHASSHLADNAEHPLGPAIYAIATLQGLPMVGEEKTRALLLAAGFGEVAVRRVAGDPFHCHYVASVPI